MSVYGLDTDHLSLHLRGHQQVGERLALSAPNSVAITIVTAEEQLRGRLAQVNKAAIGTGPWLETGGLDDPKGAV